VSLTEEILRSQMSNERGILPLNSSDLFPSRRPGGWWPMIPASRQRVRVEGRSGLFFVLSVNEEYGCADLVELNSATLVEAVRFERILPVHLEMEEDCGTQPIERQG